MKLKPAIFSLMIISSIIFSACSIGQNENFEKSYVNFSEMPDGGIYNFTYKNETIINSITILPHPQGYWSVNGIQKQFIGENIRVSVIGIKSPIIDIESRGNVMIKIIFNNFSISQVISFNGFLINDLNCVAFVNGGSFHIFNSTVIINSTTHLLLKIFIENNESIGLFSQYMQSNEFEGIVYMDKNTSIFEFINESINVSYLKIKGETIFLELGLNETDGFVILDLIGYDRPLNLTVNGIAFRNTTIVNVTNGSANSYSIMNVNGSYVYLIYISGIFENSTKQNNFYASSIFFPGLAILIIAIASYITLRKMVKK